MEVIGGLQPKLPTTWRIEHPSRELWTVFFFLTYLDTKHARDLLQGVSRRKARLREVCFLTQKEKTHIQ